MRFSIIVFLFFSVQLYSVSGQNIEIINNYNNWGWDSVYVVKNKYISVAVVPKAAGRILEYNLGNTPSLWVNPKLFGKSFTPNEEAKANDWRNFGGYRLVPIPVNNCAVDANGNKTKRWPPPVVIGDSPYGVSIKADQDGNESIFAQSGVQELPVPTYDGKNKRFNHPSSIDEYLQYSRVLAVENNSSIVNIVHSLKNTGQKIIERGLKISSQHTSWTTFEEMDGDNYVAYIPFNESHKLPNGEPFHIGVTPDSRWQYVNRNRMPLDKNNPEHVKTYYNRGTNWTGEVAQGIYEVHYDYNMMGGLHIISSKSWIAYANKLKNVVFVKRFAPYSKHLNYEGGMNMEIFNSGLETGYLETEVKTPIYKLTSGEHFDYEEIQASAKVTSFPVLDVNEIGIITKHLAFESINNKVSGSYGVFREGQAMLRIKNDQSNVLFEIPMGGVNPLVSFDVSKELNVIIENGTIELIIKDGGGKEYLLDFCKVITNR